MTVRERDDRNYHFEDCTVDILEFTRQMPAKVREILPKSVARKNLVQVAVNGLLPLWPPQSLQSRLYLLNSRETML